MPDVIAPRTQCVAEHRGQGEVVLDEQNVRLTLVDTIHGILPTGAVGVPPYEFRTATCCTVDQHLTTKEYPLAGSLMRIADIRLRHVTGRMPSDGLFWEERLIRPVDVYPAYRAQGPDVLPIASEGGYRIETYFVEIESDEGVVGIGGPIPIQ